MTVTAVVSPLAIAISRIEEFAWHFGFVIRFSLVPLTIPFLRISPALPFSFALLSFSTSFGSGFKTFGGPGPNLIRSCRAIRVSLEMTFLVTAVAGLFLGSGLVKTLQNWEDRVTFFPCESIFLTRLSFSSVADKKR